MIFSIILPIVVSIHLPINSKGAVLKYSRMGRGLTQLPNDIPCDVWRILLWRNSISRIEADSFPCQTEVARIDLRYNSLVYIHPDAFQFCTSLTELYLSDNEHLSQLPSSFGPNTANMEQLWIANLDLYSLPTAFFRNFGSLLSVNISVAGPVGNDFLKGLSSLKNLNIGRWTVPNMTGRVPKLEMLNIYSPEVQIPAENIYGLNMVRVVIREPWTYIPAFEGAVRLQKVNAGNCLVRELPDFSQHHDLKIFDVDTSQFQCNPNCCWMLFEDTSADGLAWIPNIRCQGPSNLFGRSISNISTLQARCFESKPLCWALWIEGIPIIVHMVGTF